LLSTGYSEALSNSTCVQPCQEVSRNIGAAPKPVKNSSAAIAQLELMVTPAACSPNSQIPRPGHRLKRKQQQLFHLSLGFGYCLFPQ